MPQAVKHPPRKPAVQPPGVAPVMAPSSAAWPWPRNVQRCEPACPGLRRMRRFRHRPLSRGRGCVLNCEATGQRERAVGGVPALPVSTDIAAGCHPYPGGLATWLRAPNPTLTESGGRQAGRPNSPGPIGGQAAGSSECSWIGSGVAINASDEALEALTF